MRDIFVLPPDRRARTGGNLYNRHLIAALREEGLRAGVMGIEQASRHARGAHATRYWIDMLLMDRVGALRACADAASRCFLIVHYFPSLQPGLERRRGETWRRAEAAAFAAADGFLVTSAFSARQLASRGVAGKPVMVVPPAPVVSVEWRRREALPMRALVVANVTADKGILDLLRGLAAGLPREGDLVLEIAGRLDADPAYAARCRRLVERSAALRGKGRFLGALGPAALARAYGRNAFFVSASRMESFGMALQEARHCGLYVLTLDAGNAAAHVPHASAGEALESSDALCDRVAALARDPVSRARLLGRMRPPAAAPTWRDAARRFLAQLARSTA